MVTVSAKIPEELKQKMNDLEIAPSSVIRKAIEEEVRRKELERLKKMLAENKAVLGKLSVERAVRSIREDRDSRWGSSTSSTQVPS